MPLELGHLLINYFRKVLIFTFIVKKKIYIYIYIYILKIFFKPMLLGYLLTFPS